MKLFLVFSVFALQFLFWGCNESPVVQNSSPSNLSDSQLVVAHLYPPYRNYILLTDISYAPQTDPREIETQQSVVENGSLVTIDASPRVQNDSLELLVDYAPGCKDSTQFTLYLARSKQNQQTVLASLDAKGPKLDSGQVFCAGLSFKSLMFDLTPLKKDLNLSGTILIQAVPETHTVNDTPQVYIPFNLSY